MSNSKVRKALEAQAIANYAKDKANKVYLMYQKNETLLTNYQMCKAYFKDSGASIIGIVESILKEKYNLPWQLKFIRMATQGARGKTNAQIVIPQFKYDERVNDILSKYVKKNFEKMIADQKKNSTYPFMFRDLIEKHS
jgi:hypothetical protein